jgi:PEGA domain-containing protein/tetratricopeptide repeat protein
MRTAVSNLTVVCLLLSARLGRAHDPREVAGEHFARGFSLASHGDFEAALREFNDAYAASPHFSVLYNIGQAHVALGRPVSAIETLTRYLDEGGDEIPSDRQRQVATQIAALEAALGHLSIRTDQPGVRILVDGRNVGRTPLPRSIDVAAGRHEVSASYDGSKTTTRVIAIGQDEVRILELRLPPPTAESAAAAARQAVLEATTAAETARRAAAAADAALRVVALTQAASRAASSGRTASTAAARAATAAAEAVAIEETSRGRATPAGGGR